jgi:hypothetical protein
MYRGCRISENVSQCRHFLCHPLAAVALASRLGAQTLSRLFDVLA